MRSLRFSTLKAGSALLLAGTFGVACEAVDSPTGVVDPNLAVGDRIADEVTVNPGVVLVCAFYPDGEAFGASTFSAEATAGEVYAGTFEIQSVPNCFEVWNDTDDSPATVTAALLDNPDNLVLDRIVTLVGAVPEITTFTGVTSASVDVSDLVGGNIWFKFNKQDVPNEGGEGCTPGYWRQDQHFDSWTGFAPSDLFSDVFGVDYPGTLLDGVWARGGGVNALVRHAVAALLNASSAGVEYDYSVAQVIGLFQAAYSSGDRQVIESQKNAFDFLNNQGCGLN